MGEVRIVHGFMFDPGDVGGPNDPEPFMQDVREWLNLPNAISVSWYSVPFGFRPARPLASTLQTIRAWTSAWAAGHATPYAHAWELAEFTAAGLADILSRRKDVTLIAHSLGARVALQAAAQAAPGSITRIVLLNGSELAPNARAIMEYADVRVLNLVVQTDDVLKWLGSRFTGEAPAPCVGQAGLQAWHPNWRDVPLDDPGLRARARHARGWDLCGDNPARLLDHWYTYRHVGNAPLVQAWLAGDPLDDIL